MQYIDFHRIGRYFLPPLCMLEGTAEKYSNDGQWCPSVQGLMMCGKKSKEDGERTNRHARGTMPDPSHRAGRAACVVHMYLYIHINKRQGGERWIGSRDQGTSRLWMNVTDNYSRVSVRKLDEGDTTSLVIPDPG
jgi:hypothetical protein